jgi:DNA-binding MarR family transcriptional regulator
MGLIDVQADPVPGQATDVPGRSAVLPGHSTVLIARVARVVRQRFEQVLAPLGLRQRHLVALSYLRSNGPTAQQQLADSLCMDASSMVCLLNELEESALVERHRDRSDRRRGIIELSISGARALCEVDEALQVVEDEVLSRLGSTERVTLNELLAKLDVCDPDWALIAKDE